METSSTPMELDSFHTCGICGKAITDQGVLDCCQHLFCFSCIDDWASVTNLCPICKLRFRLITCLPGRSAQPSSEQESASDRRRDDDQLGPSFYIDEEAVTCLEGDECLVRSGKAFEVEADDTSVACDSCDCWYHAGCVGFDTSGCTQESWWCPRCVRGTDANPGTHSASKQSAAAVVLDPAGFQAQTAVEITACIQQRNNHEATTLETQPPLPPSESRMSKSTPLTTSDTTEDKNPRKRRRTDVEIATAVDLPDSDRNVQGVQGLIVRSSTKGISQSTCTNSNDLQEKARSPQTGGHEAADDLLEIVKDPGYRVAEADEGGGYKSPRSAGENAVRTRIIMHRAESGESSVVEQIRQQMRNAAGYGAAEDLGQVDLSDGRFLAAYRAAVAAKDKADVQSKRSVQKGSSWVIKALTRGTSVRDKLTRKLYGGTSTRRTWDRDWDVAFWKGGRGASKKCCDSKVPPESTSEQTDPAADKVYLADSSLFARKDDNDPPDAPDSDCRFTVDLCHMNLSDKVLGKGPLIDCRGNGQQFSQQHIGPYSKSKSRKDLAGASSATPLAKLDVNDKRKWALEVLARKKGELGPAGSLDSKHEKGQSLVDFLPLELRPSIDISLSSKIPSAVRQVQLNRILEHELRSCGVRRNPRSVKCQQAIAAAVSKEQKIFEKSNTKGVYVNLCARATSKSTSTEKVKVNLTAASSSTDCKVREALQAAGLLSDSDSDSPPVNLVESSCLTSEFKEEKPSQKVHSRISDEGNGTSPIPVSAQSDGVASQELPGRSSMTPEVLSLDLHREQPSLGAEIFCSSPLYLDEDFGLDDEELETPMIIGHTASTGQKDGTSKVKVVLTTFNKFKHAPASTEAETEAAKPETLIGDLDNGVARCNGTESAEAVCRDTSSGAAVEGTVDNDCMLLAGPVVDAKVIDSDCLVNPTQAEVVTMASESAETHATSSEGQHEAPKLNGLRGASVELEEGLDACKDNLSASPKSRTVDTPSDAILEGRKACEKIVVTTTEDRDVAGEADLDDWMKVGKFPNLESRIEEVRTRVLKKSTGVLTKLLTKYPTSAPNDLEGSCVGIEGVDTECTLNEKDMEESLDGLDVAHQSEAKAANPSIQKQVHSYVREHLRPLFKSGVITAKEYQWATAKTASKVMQYHPGAKSAAFLIAEGSKVKKLAEDYLQAFTQRKS